MLTWTMKRRKVRLMSIIVALYSFFAILCINGIKKILFFAMMLCGSKKIVSGLRKFDLVSFFGFVYPIIVIIVSTMVSGDFVQSFMSTYCCFLLLSVYVIKGYKLDFEKIFYSSIYVMVYIIISIFLFDLFGVFDVNQMNPIKSLVYRLDIGLMGKSPEYYFYYSIFLYASPLLIFTLIKSLEDKKYLRAVFVFAAILLTGERAPFFVSIMAVLVYTLILRDKLTHNKVRVIVLVGMLGLCILAVYGKDIWNSVYQIMFVKGELSNSTRAGHFESVLREIRQNRMILLHGQGMGSYFFTTGSNKFKNSIELPYLNLVRQMGIPLFALFMFFLLYPLIKIPKNKGDYIAYIGYLLIAAINPFLFDSTAYLVYVYVYSKYVVHSKLVCDSNGI